MLNQAGQIGGSESTSERSVAYKPAIADHREANGCADTEAAVGVAEAANVEAAEQTIAAAAAPTTAWLQRSLSVLDRSGVTELA